MKKKSPGKSDSKKSAKNATAKKASAKKSLTKKAAPKKAASKKSASRKSSSKKASVKGTASLRGYRPVCRECDWSGNDCFPTKHAALVEGVKLHGKVNEHAIDSESC